VSSKDPVQCFGQHLTLDGYGCNFERLIDLDAIYQFLDTCPDVIAVDYVTERFGIEKCETNVLDRGLEFPREIRTVENLLRQERKAMRG